MPYESKIIAHVTAHEILEITPQHRMRSNTRLDIKVRMDKHQAADFILSLMEDFGENEICQALGIEGYKIVKLEPWQSLQGDL